MMKKKLNLNSLEKQRLDNNLSNKILGGLPSCGNTCDCSCSCDMNNTQQLNTNVSSVSSSSRDNGFISNAHVLWHVICAIY